MSTCYEDMTDGALIDLAQKGDKEALGRRR